MTYPTYEPGFPPPPPPPPPPYVQSPYPYGPQRPGYAPMTSWAPPLPQPAPRKVPNSLPWLVAGLLALLVAAAISVVVFLQDPSPAVVADPPAQTTPSTEDGPVADPRPLPSLPSDCLVECSQAPGPGDPETGAHYSGSGDAATAFVQDIAHGDVNRAHAALCGEGKTQFPTPEDLVEDFYATFGISEITAATLTGVHAADDLTDAVDFELQTDVGKVTVEVFIVEEASSLTVCGYDLAQ